LDGQRRVRKTTADERETIGLGPFATEGINEVAFGNEPIRLRIDDCSI
jgi:hypothetical protein